MKLNKDSLLAIIYNPKNDTNKVKAYHMLGTMTAADDAEKAIEYTKAGIQLGKQIGYDRGVASCMLSTSYFYGLLNRIPEALYYIDSTIHLYKKIGKTDRLSFCYKSRAEYEQKTGRLVQSLRDCDTAIFYAEKTNNNSTRKYVYKLMAEVYFYQGEYLQSEEYYKKAYEEHASAKDSIPMAENLAGLGRVTEKTKQYEQSISYFRNAIQIIADAKQENYLSGYYNSLSDVLLKKGAVDESETAALNALEFAKSEKNKQNLAAALQTLSTIYMKRGNTRAALKAAAVSYEAASSLGAKEIKKNSADVMAEGYFKQGEYKNAFYYLQISKLLSDSLSNEKYSKDVTGVLARFKVNEKDNEIILLNKDKELQKQKLQKQQLLMAGTAVLALLSLAGLWLLMNRNKLRQRMKELELRNQIAADLHDEVGSSLSSIHMLSQMATQQGTDEKQKNVLQRMSSNAKETMDKMGDIVWMIKPGETEAAGLKQRMERFAYEICSSKNIETTIELNDLENVKLTMEQRKNFYLIFKEALNNAVKYSGTEKIDIKAEMQQKQLTLLVKDHGKGFESRLIRKGNGLDNMQNRAKESGAVLQVDSNNIDGTVVKLTMPV